MKKRISILTMILGIVLISANANPPVGARSVVLTARFESGNSANPNYVSIQTNGPGGKFVRELNTNYRDNLDSIKLVGDISYYDLKLLTNKNYNNFKVLKYIDLSDANIVAFNRLDYTDYKLQKVDDFLCEATGGTYGCDLQRYDIMQDTISWCYVNFEDRDFPAGYLPNSSFTTISATVNTDGKHTYSPTSLDNLILPSNLETIGDSAFVGIIPFTTGHKMTLTIPETVTKIGKYAFASTNEYSGYDHSYGIDTIIIKSNVEIGRHAFPTMNKFVVDNKAYPTVKFDIPSPDLTMEQNSFFGNFGYLDFPVYDWIYRKKSTDTYYSLIQNLNGQAYNDSTKRVLIAPWGYMDSNTYNFPDAANLNLQNWMLSTDSSKVGSVDLYVTKGTKSYYQNSNVWKYFDLVEFGTNTPTSIIDVIPNHTISLYPNPCTNGFYLSTIGEYTIININGTIIKKFNIESSDTYIDMNEYPDGIYFIKSNRGDCFKLIKR